MFCCLQLINTLYRYRPTQQQEGGSDCGLFAIAFAGVLASGCHPSSFKFKQSEMREHLRQCLVASQLSDFPTAKKGREKKCCEEELPYSSFLQLPNARSFQRRNDQVQPV